MAATFQTLESNQGPKPNKRVNRSRFAARWSPNYGQLSSSSNVFKGGTTFHRRRNTSSGSKTGKQEETFDRFEVRERFRNNASKRRVPPFPRPEQHTEFHPSTENWRHTRSTLGFDNTDRDHWVKNDGKTRHYRRNHRYTKPKNFEALPPTSQRIQAPTPITPEPTRVDSRSFAEVARQPAKPSAERNV